MASLRLTFPEKDQPTVIALTGARLTIGRLPFNTIQIIDRTISGFHAELISEHGHYRLHDRGSSNGTFVNGQKVSDYHLNEACTISFGTVEAQFQPEDVAPTDEVETFPSRGEVNAVRQENVEMRATVAALREEIDALRRPAPATVEAGGASDSREEFEKLVIEREALKESQVRLEEELNRLKTDLAILKRDRINLQLAYDSAQRELDKLRQTVGGAEASPELAPSEAAAVLAAQADGEATTPTPTSPPVPVASSTPSAPSAPSAPPSAPQPPSGLPKPSAPLNIPFKPVKPVALPSPPPATPAAGPLAKAPPGLGVPGHPIKPAVPGAGPAPAPGEKPGLPPAKPPLARPMSAKLPLQPTVKLIPVPPPATGPKGTQKLSE